MRFMARHQAKVIIVPFQAMKIPSQEILHEFGKMQEVFSILYSVEIKTVRKKRQSKGNVKRNDTSELKRKTRPLVT